MPDPIEKIVEDALISAGIDYVRDPHPAALNLDFFLTGYGVHIECKQFHTDRIAAQMARAPNVIAIQGIEAARLFARNL